MITSVILSVKGLTCYKDDGSVLNIPSEFAPDVASVTQMLENIRTNGYTTLIGLSSENLLNILMDLGFKARTHGTAVHVETEAGPVDVAPLTDLITHSHEAEQPEPITALINRIAGIDRNHSKEDLVKFIQLSEMPVTVDGRLVAFKRVRKNEYGVNYDCHSGTLLNNVGCRVSMSIDQVDPDRSNDCSYGLHVASRNYLRYFGGNALLLILVNPEDVIAVPQYNATKVRVCSYDIVHEFTAEQTENILSYDSLDEDVWGVLRSFIEGKSYVINKTVTEISQGQADVVETHIDVTPEGMSVSDTYAAPVAKTEDSKGVEMKKVVKEVKQKTRTSQFESLYLLWAAEDDWKHKKSRFMDLLEFKRRQKKSWKTLGANLSQEKELKKFEDRIK